VGTLAGGGRMKHLQVAYLLEEGGTVRHMHLVLLARILKRGLAAAHIFQLDLEPFPLLSTHDSHQSSVV
jgi:hypothetical protein